MEKVLEVNPDVEAALKPHECPACGFVNNVTVGEIVRVADSGVMEGKPYQIIEIITVTCQQCGTQYTNKNYL